MADRIKGITVEIGGDTTGLSKALSGVNKDISSTQKQLKDVERLLKLDPGNTELLRQKQELLGKSIEDTEKKLEALNQANEKVSKSVKNYNAWKTAYDPIQKEIDETSKQLKALRDRQQELKDSGEIDTNAYKDLQTEIQKTNKILVDLKKRAKEVSDEFGNPVSPEQYNSLQREILATEISWRDLKSESQKAENAVKGIDEKPVEEVAKAADEAGDALEDAGKEASNFGDFLKADALVEGAKGIVSSLKDIAEESKEQMKIMGSLEVSSQNAGYSAEETSQSYRTLFGVLGDNQTAATTTANLQALGLAQGDLERLINGTIGAWATYGDSIPIDSLSEAINETVQTGKVTGTFADVLNWAGTSEDDFNKKLEAATSAAERANLVLNELSSQGLTDAGQAWQDNNKALVESNKASADLSNEIAELGETVMPVFTEITNVISGLLGWFNSLSPETQKFIGIVLALVAAIGPIAGIIQSITVVQGALNVVMMANPIMLIVAAIAALVAAFVLLWNNCEGFRQFWINLWEKIKQVFSDVWNAIVGFFTETIPNAIGKVTEIFQKFDSWLTGIFSTDWSESFGAFGEVINAFFANVKNIWNSIKKVFHGIIDFVSGVFSGDWSKAWEGIKSIFSGIWDGFVAIVKMPINGIIGLINAMIDGINWVIEKINTISFDVPDWVPFVGGQTWGFNLPTIGNIPYLAKGGVLSQGSAVVGEAGPELLTMAGGRAVVQPLTNQTSNTANFGGVNFYVYGAPGQDINELTDQIMDRMETVYQMKGAVWG